MNKLNLYEIVEDVKKMLVELNERRENSIEQCCNYNGLDARNAAHYAKAASKVCEYATPPTLKQRGLFSKLFGAELRSGNDARYTSCRLSEKAYNEDISEEEAIALYGFWKDLERSVKRDRKEIGAKINEEAGRCQMCIEGKRRDNEKIIGDSAYNSVYYYGFLPGGVEMSS